MLCPLLSHSAEIDRRNIELCFCSEVFRDATCKSAFCFLIKMRVCVCLLQQQLPGDHFQFDKGYRRGSQLASFPATGHQYNLPLASPQASPGPWSAPSERNCTNPLVRGLSLHLASSSQAGNHMGCKGWLGTRRSAFSGPPCFGAPGRWESRDSSSTFHGGPGG